MWWNICPTWLVNQQWNHHSTYHLNDAAHSLPISLPNRFLFSGVTHYNSIVGQMSTSVGNITIANSMCKLNHGYDRPTTYRVFTHLNDDYYHVLVFFVGY